MHGNYQNRPNRSKDSVQEVKAVPVKETVVSTEASVSQEIIGSVVDCTSLSIREAPVKTAPIVMVILAGSEVMIDEDHSTDEFYKIFNAAGIEGYCMRQYIKVHR